MGVSVIYANSDIISWIEMTLRKMERGYTVAYETDGSSPSIVELA